MALNTTLSGINAAQSDLSVIANNIANANTTGFKGSRAEFADLFAVTGLNLSSTEVGGGTHLQEVAQTFSQGDINTTGQSLDLAISGNGFFVVNNGSGVSYTRAGDFQKSPDGNNVVTPGGAKLQVYPPNGAGGFDTSTLGNLQLNSAEGNAKATGLISVSSNLPSSSAAPTAAFSPGDSTTFNDATPVTVYDSQGGAHQGTVYYVKTATNSWDAHVFVDGQDAGKQSLTFDTSGNLATPANGKLSFNPVTLGNGSSPLTLSLNVVKTTQFGTDYSAGTVSQDGYQAGILTTIGIDSKGIVTANYSNNQSTQLGQIALANFGNLQGLSQIGSAGWKAGTDSGAAVMGSPGVGQFGALQSGALEDSNTANTTEQLVNMIKAQRNYQANAQVLSTDNTLASALFSAVSR